MEISKIQTKLPSCSSFFGLSFILVFALSAYFISNVWLKWSSSPVIITLNPVSTSISEFPFPAITVCNMNQAKKSAVTGISKDSPRYSILQRLCADSIQFNESDARVEKWSRFSQFMLDVAQSCNAMLLMCRYGGDVYNCSDLFNTILTDEGLCCIFNGVHPRYLLREYR